MKLVGGENKKETEIGTQTRIFYKQVLLDHLLSFEVQGLKFQSIIYLNFLSNRFCNQSNVYGHTRNLFWNESFQRTKLKTKLLTRKHNK